METIESVSDEIVTEATVESRETGEFELKMLDCGTNYEIGESLPTCLSCFCGSGCFCGSATT